MGSLFKRPKIDAAKAAPPPEPLPEPDLIEEGVGEEVKKRARRRGGRRATILTGDLAKPAESSIGRKTLLG